MPKPTPSANSRSPGNADLPIGSSPGHADLLIGSSPASEIANQEIGVPGGDRGWHNRGYLPHFDAAGVIQHVTFHLADSLPKSVVERLDEEIGLLPPEKRNAERRKRIDAWIDAGHGACLLRIPEVADKVQATLLHFEGSRYRLLAWVVMPNHVHVLVEPIWPLAKIVASWKKFSARQIYDHLRATGREPDAKLPVWHREYWDRFMRNEEHLKQTLVYILENPVEAKLVATAEEWCWSSAWAGRKNQSGDWSAQARQSPDWPTL